MAVKEKTLEDRVVELRDAGEHWAAISEQLGIGQGRAWLLWTISKVPPNQRITGKDDDDLGAKIVKARDDQLLSWGTIAARAGIPESKVRSLYAKTSGVSSRGLRIGKGGRRPGENGAAAPATRTTKKAAARPEPAKVSSAEARKPLVEMSLTELKNRLNGKTITVKRLSDGGKITKIKVKNVKSIKNGELNFTDEDGAARTIPVTEIKGATR